MDSFGVALDLGMRLAVPVLMFAFLGNYLNKRYGLGEGWILALILFGVTSGIWNVYKMLSKMVPIPTKARAEEQKDALKRD